MHLPVWGREDDRQSKWNGSNISNPVVMPAYLEHGVWTAIDENYYVTKRWPKPDKMSH